MAVLLTYLDHDFATSAQLVPAQMQELAASGIRGIINNRPDGEGGPQQPANSALQAAAESAGLVYTWLPVHPANISADEVATFAALLESLPRPLVAFCRTGTRSGKLYRAAASRTTPS